MMSFLKMLFLVKFLGVHVENSRACHSRGARESVSVGFLLLGDKRAGLPIGSAAGRGVFFFFPMIGRGRAGVRDSGASKSIEPVLDKGELPIGR